MPRSLSQLASRVRLAVDLRLPDKPVRRRVRGIDMLLPRRHVLPYLVQPGSPYAENLVGIARRIREAEGDLCLLDIGANVGDSVMMVLDRAPGSAVCVEPDPEWLRYLRANVGSRPEVEIAPVVLLGSEAAEAGPLSVVHHAVGTSQIARSDEGEGLSAISTDELLRRHPRLGGVRLVKTDTDGYDVMLVPELIRTFADSKPVVFFEFDPRPTREATPELDPDGLWPTLVEAGYEQAVVWDNGGRLLGAAPTGELGERTGVLDLPQQQRGYGFWDIAVAHCEDPVGLAALAHLAGGRQLA